MMARRQRVLTQLAQALVSFLSGHGQLAGCALRVRRRPNSTKASTSARTSTAVARVAHASASDELGLGEAERVAAW